eukprot:Lankesteria_metandrocarpae@DN10965_c0_g1_i1.p1
MGMLNQQYYLRPQLYAAFSRHLSQRSVVTIQDSATTTPVANGYRTLKGSKDRIWGKVAVVHCGSASNGEHSYRSGLSYDEAVRCVNNLRNHTPPPDTTTTTTTTGPTTATSSSNGCRTGSSMQPQSDNAAALESTADVDLI